MADGFGSFLQGLQAGQATLAHQQALADSKLRQQILKHQIDNLKIDDQLRQREIAAQQVNFLTGQPEANLPSEQVPQQQVIPATQGIPGLIQGLLASKVGTPPEDGALPRESPAIPTPQTAATPTQVGPLAQGDRFTTTTRRALPITIPGVSGNGYNIPSIQVRPQSMEDLMRQKAMEKNFEGFTLGPNQVRFENGRQVAAGPRIDRYPTPAELAYEASGYNAWDAMQMLHPPKAAPAARLVQGAVVDGVPNQMVWADPGSKKFYDASGEEIEGEGRVTANPKASSANAATQAETALRGDYRLFKANYLSRYGQKQADITRALLAGGDWPAKPLAEPSYEKWKVMSDEERQKVLANPADRITDAEQDKREKAQKAKQPTAATTPQTGAAQGGVPAEVAAALADKAPGKRYRLSDGSYWEKLPDGTIQPASQ